MTKTTVAKRLWSVILTLCMATALFAGLALAAPVTAHAAGDIVNETPGDMTYGGYIAENIVPGYGVYLIAGGSITIDAGVDISTVNGVISLLAGDNITLDRFGFFSAPGNPIIIEAGGSISLFKISFAGSSLTLTAGVASTLNGCDFTGIAGDGAIVVTGNVTFENCSFSSWNAVVATGPASVTYINCTFPPAPAPSQSPDHGTDAYYQRHYDYWLSVYTQLQASANDATITVDTAGQGLDHIQHFVFDALVNTNRTLVVKHHDNKTYTIRGMAEAADGTMNGIQLGHNQLFYGNLDRFRT